MDSRRPVRRKTTTEPAERQLRWFESVRHLVQRFSRTASSSFHLPAALTACCHEVPAAFGIGGASAWVHDRRTHELVLTASSGTALPAEGTRVPVDEPGPPAAAMRAPCPVRLADWRGGSALGIPLRGRRRALGVLMLEGVAPDQAERTEFLSAAAELGVQLSSAIENLLLLEDVLTSRREMTQMFDSLEDLVALCDGRLRVVQTNRALSARIHLPRGQVIDRPLADFLGQEAARWLAAGATLEDLSAGAGATREFDDELLGGRFAMTLAALPAQDGRQGGAVFVARDVTSRARLEAERAALNEQLAQSQKLASLGQFVAGIAHELNNPLQGIISHLELLQREGRVPNGIRRELGAVAREADRAARIVGNLLMFAGGRKAEVRPIRLNSVVRYTLHLRRAACEAAHVQVVTRLDESEPRVSANRILLQQALLNLVVNALQELAALGGGRIVVSTRRVGTSKVRLQVRDTGPGIAADALPRIFEPFYSTKTVGRGTGLGLAVAYGVVKDHHGTISAENHRDGGAVFTIELPLVKEPRAEPLLPQAARRSRRDG